MKKLNFFKENQNWLKPFLTSGLNQAVSSGTTFMINLYLVSIFNPENFGIYGVGFAIIIFIGGIGNALFLTQMTVIYPKKKKNEKERFVNTVLNLVVLFSFGILGLCCFFICLRSFIPINYYWSNQLILAITFASIMYLIKVYFVRTAYNYQDEIKAVYIHSSIIITIALLFILEKQLFDSLNTTFAFVIYGFAHFVGVILGFYLLKAKASFAPINKLKSVFSELWVGGKWAALSNVVFSLRTQAHTIISLLIIGPAALGNMNAARLFVTPAVMAIPVVAMLALPRLSSIRETNKSEIFKKGRTLSLIYLSIGGSYSLALLLSYDSIIDGFFDESYNDLFGLTILWCIYATMLALRCGQDVIVQALQKFKKLTVVNFLSACTTLVSGYVLSKILGLKGILFGLILGELLLSLMLLIIIRQEKTSFENLSIDCRNT